MSKISQILNELSPNQAVTNFGHEIKLDFSDVTGWNLKGTEFQVSTMDIAQPIQTKKIDQLKVGDKIKNNNEYVYFLSKVTGSSIWVTNDYKELQDYSSTNNTPKDIIDLVKKLDLDSFGKVGLYYNIPSVQEKEYFLVCEKFVTLTNDSIKTIQSVKGFQRITFHPDLNVLSIGFLILKNKEFIK